MITQLRKLALMRFRNCHQHETAQATGHILLLVPFRVGDQLLQFINVGSQASCPSATSSPIQLLLVVTVFTWPMKSKRTF
jgi:hypothetical protein